MMKWAGCSPVSQREPGATGDSFTVHQAPSLVDPQQKTKAKVKSRAKILNEELFLVQNANSHGSGS